MTAKHAAHCLSECPDLDLCQQLPVDKFTRKHKGTSHATNSFMLSFVGQVRVFQAIEDLPVEVYRKVGPNTWEEIA